MVDINMLQKLSLNRTELVIGGNLFELSDNISPHSGMENYFYPYCQGKTGYCWLESTLQCVSIYVKQNTGRNYFFDDRYLMFFDKLEKANLFFENIMQEINSSISDKCNSYIMRNAMTDKGQWQMSQNLIEKYGVVLLDKKYENVVRTSELNMYISYLLRISAFKIRKIYHTKKDLDEINKIRNDALQNIYNVLVAYYGNQYEKYASPMCENLTPKEFYDETIAFPFDDYISIYPTNNCQMVEKEMYYDGNIAEFGRNKFLGVSNEYFNELLDRQLKQDGFCWCSGDFGKFYIKKTKILDDSCFNDNSAILGNLKLDDFDRIDTFDNYLANISHAFVVSRAEKYKNEFEYYAYDSAYDFTKGEACWISRSWIDKYLLQAVVRKKDINEIQKIKKIKEYPWNFFRL